MAVETDLGQKIVGLVASALNSSGRPSVLVPSQEMHLPYQKKLESLRTPELVDLDLRGPEGYRNIVQAAQFAREGGLISFSCGGVYGIGGRDAETMTDLIVPIKRDMFRKAWMQAASSNGDEFEDPGLRDYSADGKPPIYLTSFPFIRKVVDFQGLGEHLGLSVSEGVSNARKFIKQCYDGLLLHMVLPIREEYRSLLPFTLQTKEGVCTAAFMTMRGYPPMHDFVNAFEALGKKDSGTGLATPFMATSFAHAGMEAVLTADRAHLLLEAVEPEVRRTVLLLGDGLMDEIVGREWEASGGSQSILDFVNGGPETVVVRRRGTVAPEVVRPLFQEYGLGLGYMEDHQDLYPNQEPPITTPGQMEEMIERLKLSP